MMTPLRSKEECGRLGRQAAPGRAAPASADQAGKQFAFAWHGSAAASLLDGWSTIPDDGVTAKQRGRRQPLSASSSFQCWPDRQTVCIRLAWQRSRKLAGCVRFLRTAPLQSKEEGELMAATFVGKQLLSVPARQANNLHSPRTIEHPQACSTVGRRSLMMVAAPKLGALVELKSDF